MPRAVPARTPRLTCCSVTLTGLPAAHGGRGEAAAQAGGAAALQGCGDGDTAGRRGQGIHQGQVSARRPQALRADDLRNATHNHQLATGCSRANLFILSASALRLLCVQVLPAEVKSQGQYNVTAIAIDLFLSGAGTVRVAAVAARVASATPAVCGGTSGQAPA